MVWKIEYRHGKAKILEYNAKTGRYDLLGMPYKAKNYDNAQSLAELVMFKGTHHIEDGKVVKNRAEKMVSEHSTISSSPKNSERRDLYTAADQEGAEGEQDTAKKTTKKKTMRKSKTGVASYKKGESCGRGKHNFKSFGSYSVCMRCGSRKTHGTKSKASKGHGKGHKRGTRAKVEAT